VTERFREAASDYWRRVTETARELGGDGCSGPTLQVFRSCCDEHDIHYRTGQRLDGRPITRGEADAEFRRCMQQRSRLGRWSPMPWWRWLAVRAVGWAHWDGHQRGES
jgi:hypothetical protein